MDNSALFTSFKRWQAMIDCRKNQQLGQAYVEHQNIDLWIFPFCAKHLLHAMSLKPERAKDLSTKSFARCFIWQWNSLCWNSLSCIMHVIQLKSLTQDLLNNSTAFILLKNFLIYQAWFYQHSFSGATFLLSKPELKILYHPQVH